MKKRELKRENKYLKNKNIHLAKIIGILSDDVKDKENEIDKLKSDSSVQCAEEKMKKIFANTPTNEFVVGCNVNNDYFVSVDGGKTEIYKNSPLFDAFYNNQDVFTNPYKKENSSFSTRFMPNVKFSILSTKNRDLFKTLGFPMMCNYIRTSFNGEIVDMCDYQGNYDKWTASKEVSIYEAIPELVPEKMYYNKDSDSLKPFATGGIIDTLEEWEKKAFKVTEVISKCDSCKVKDDCSLLRELGNYPYVSHCDDYQEKDGSDKDGGYESLQKALDDAVDNIDIEALAKKMGCSMEKKIIIDDFTRQIDDITTIAFNKLDKLLKK